MLPNMMPYLTTGQTERAQSSGWTPSSLETLIEGCGSQEAMASVFISSSENDKESDSAGATEAVYSGS